MTNLIKRYASACRFVQKINKASIAASVSKWVAACGGPKIKVEFLTSIASANLAVRTQRHEWDKKKPKAATAVWSAWQSAPAGLMAMPDYGNIKGDGTPAGAVKMAHALRDAFTNSAGYSANRVWSDSVAARSLSVSFVNDIQNSWNASRVSIIAIEAKERKDMPRYSVWRHVFDAFEQGAWFICLNGNTAKVCVRPTVTGNTIRWLGSVGKLLNRPESDLCQS